MPINPLTSLYAFFTEEPACPEQKKDKEPPIEPRSAAAIALQVVQKKAQSSKHVQQLFEILNKTRGVSEKNYLLFEPRFIGNPTFSSSIDRIHPDHLSHSVMWGVDSTDRPFIATRYSCSTATEPSSGVTTLFQRYSDNKQNWIAAGAHFGLHWTCPASSFFDPEMDFAKTLENAAKLWKNISIDLPIGSETNKNQVYLV